MLDYRAHKLFWLVCLPTRIVGRIGFYAIVFVAIMIAQATSFRTTVKIALAYVAMEALGGLVFAIWNRVVNRLINGAFFWLIDVVPAHGADAEEARAIVEQGRAFELTKKLDGEIERWTDEDTEELISLTNWRARWLFPVRERVEQMVSELQRIHADTGKQPREIGERAIDEMRNRLCGKISWVERAIVNPYIFNSIVGLALIVLVIGIFPVK